MHGAALRRAQVAGSTELKGGNAFEPTYCDIQTSLSCDQGGFELGEWNVNHARDASLGCPRRQNSRLLNYIISCWPRVNEGSVAAHLMSVALSETMVRTRGGIRVAHSRRTFSICGAKFKGVFQPHRLHGSLRGRQYRLKMASRAGASKRSAARLPEVRRVDIGWRGHPATVPIIARSAHRSVMLPRGGRLYTRTGVYVG